MYSTRYHCYCGELFFFAQSCWKIKARIFFLKAIFFFLLQYGENQQSKRYDELKKKQLLETISAEVVLPVTIVMIPPIAVQQK